MKYLGKYRLANVDPNRFTLDKFHHCFSAIIIDEDEHGIDIKIDSILDSQDDNKFGQIYKLKFKQLSEIQSSLIKVF